MTCPLPAEPPDAASLCPSIDGVSTYHSVLLRVAVNADNAYLSLSDVFSSHISCPGWCPWPALCGLTQWVCRYGHGLAVGATEFPGGRLGDPSLPLLLRAYRRAYVSLQCWLGRARWCFSVWWMSCLLASFWWPLHPHQMLLWFPSYPRGFCSPLKVTCITNSGYC